MRSRSVLDRIRMTTLPSTCCHGDVSGFLANLEESAHDHRPHGIMTGDVTVPAWNGYLLTVACPCGVVFERWVTPESAESDLRLLALRN